MDLKKFLKGIKPALLPVTFMLLLPSCYYDNEEVLYPGTGGCDTANVTYSGTISKIFRGSCALSGCHAGTSSQGIGNFEAYASTKAYLDVNSQKLVGAINHTAGFPQMPKGGTKLPACDILKMQVWIAKGYPDN